MSSSTLSSAQISTFNISSNAPSTLSMSKHWSYLLSDRRLGSIKVDKPAERSRTPFHKDYDRLIFSQSFRKLNQKTQVHPLTNQLGIHTRLTHSLEVSCIGRSLGMMAAQKLHDRLSDGLPRGVSVADVGVIVQAACLAHDIGNPPFGHAGEYAIRDWFCRPQQRAILDYLTPDQRWDLIGYEGNAQGFRLLTRNEHHPDKGGMRLTCATLGAFMKYPWLAPHVNHSDLYTSDLPPKITKFGCFMSEVDLLESLAQQLRLPRTIEHDGYARHPLAYLLEAADDICYALIDLEDGILLDMLSYTEVEPLLLGLIGERGAPPEVYGGAPIVQKLAALRGRAMMRLVDTVSDVFLTMMPAMLAGEMRGSLFDHCERSVYEGITHAKRLASERIFSHPSKIRMELMANRCLHLLLDAFMPLAILPYQPNSATFESRHLMQLLTTPLQSVGREMGTDVYENTLNILDFLTGMNDHEAYHLAQQLSGLYPSNMP